MTDHPQPEGETNCPYLEHYPENGGVVQRITLNHFPFAIGRSIAADFTIYSRQVSKEHAQIFRAGQTLRIRDLGSTNGTFVNGKRISETLLMNGDIVHLAHKEFRFGNEHESSSRLAIEDTTDPLKSKLPSSIIADSEHLREMLMRECVNIVFQPIVQLPTRQIIGYEALGRGDHSGLSPNPADLLRLAEQCRLATELSRLFRLVAVKDAARLPDNLRFFFNLHPSELGDDFLIESLREVQPAFQSNRQMVLEVHEAAVVDSVMMGRLRDQMEALGIELAYDDFGAGQARLKQLVEVPPHFVKFDMSLIRGIDQEKARQELVQALNRVTESVGAQVIAEGIETEAEAEACVRLGCPLGQGYLFGRPQPVAVLTRGKEIEVGASSRIGSCR